MENEQRPLTIIVSEPQYEVRLEIRDPEFAIDPTEVSYASDLLRIHARMFLANMQVPEDLRRVMNQYDQHMLEARTLVLKKLLEEKEHRE